MTEQQQRATRTLIITGYEVVATFPKKNGGEGETTIYKIVATNERGEPFDPERFPLRSFWEPSEVELGQPREYEVEAYDHPKYGRTYTVHKPKDGRGGGGLKASVDALRAEVKELRERVEALEAGGGEAKQKDEDIPF